MYRPIALTPGVKTPQLSVDLAGGGRFELSKDGGENFTLVVFYRGYHCPLCKNQLLELQNHLGDFTALGIKIISLSMDPSDRAELSRTEWELQGLDLGYGINLEDAKDWGLHLSSSRGKTSTGVEELDQFNEPGLFLVRNDGTLFASWVQTVPMARSKAQDLISLIKFVLDKNYPPRGTLTDV